MRRLGGGRLGEVGGIPSCPRSMTFNSDVRTTQAEANRQ